MQGSLQKRATDLMRPKLRKGTSWMTRRPARPASLSIIFTAKPPGIRDQRSSAAEIDQGLPSTTLRASGQAAPGLQRRWLRRGYFQRQSPWSQPNRGPQAKGRWHVVIVIAAMAFVASVAVMLTPFRSPRDVLAERTWGIGRTSTTVMTGFALGNPWWRLHTPSGLKRSPDGAVPDNVRIPRDNFVVFDDQTTLPHRSIGYDAILGMFTAVRSMFGSDLIFDWWSIVRLQQAALVVSLLAPLLAIAAFVRPQRRPLVVVAYALTFAGLLAVHPFESTWLIDGIIDSALAAPAALLAVPMVLCISARIASPIRTRLISAGCVGLSLGLITMIRGELVFAFLLAFAVSSVWGVAGSKRESSRLKPGCDAYFLLRSLMPAIVATVTLLAVPIGYGLINVAIHGHFVPFRLQSGQNLVEPVGEFENPWGIEYSDKWMIAELESRGFAYISFEADAYLTRQYVDMLAQEPMLFIRNFIARLARLDKDLAFGMLGPFTLPFLLGMSVWFGRRHPCARPALVPLVLSIGLVLFHAWFGSPNRVLAPVRFLMAGALCAGIAAATAWLVERPRHRVPKAGGHDPESTAWPARVVHQYRAR